MAALVAGVRDDQLGDPTPCPAYTVGDLLDHIGGFPIAFTAAARKERLAAAAASPRADGANLDDGFRERIGRDLAELADAWRDPAAYSGMTQAGPVDLPGEVAALVALDEVVVHGWDLDKATGQAYDPGEAAALAALQFAQSFEPPPTPMCRRRRRRWPVRPAGARPRRRPGPGPARRRHRPRPALDPADWVSPCISWLRSASGNLPGGGVSERPKENASKAFVGASPPRVQIPPPPP